MTDSATLPPNQLVHTWEDLDEIADRRTPTRPTTPTLKTYRTWSDERRRKLDEERFNYIHQLPYLDTADCKQLRKTARELIRRNRQTQGTSHGLVLDGPAFTGKSSALRTLAISHNRQTRTKRQSTDTYAQHIPVISIEVGAGSTVKGVAQKITAFMEGMQPRDSSATALMIPLQRELRACRTDLIILDEGHCLTGGQTVSDFIKELLNSTNATIVIAGIDVANTNIFLGNRRDQNKARFTTINTTQHHIATAQATAKWQGLIAGFEDRLPLLAHPKRSLAANHSDLLFDLTKGAVGSLSTLLETAYTNAIGTTEKIGKKQLNEIPPTRYRIDPTHAKAS